MKLMRQLLRSIALFATLVSCSSVAAQVPLDRGTLVIAVPREGQIPVPTLWRGDQATRELSDLLFLRLADLGPALSTTNERSFLPRLAQSWSRRNPTTLVFELDPRARWQDGTPVTSRDVLFAFERARDPKLSPQLALLLRRVQSVSAEGDHRVVVQYSEAYAEQLYDAVYHAPPLPAHLLAGIVPESLATSPFAAQPVGNGPYRLVRRVQGQLTELAANEDFFLGTPKIRRVVFLLASDPEARANLLLSGEADAVDNIYTVPNPSRLERLPQFQYYPLPGLTVFFANINPHDPADSTRPHPLFSEPAVRRALVQAIDRAAVARANYGALSTAPSGPVSAIVGRSVDAPAPLPYDTAAARRLLAQRGWADHDGDGVLDRDGKAFAFRVMVPATSSARIAVATQMQEAWRRLGISVELDVVEPGVFMERRATGHFDLETEGAVQDPTPSGLSQSWSCAGIGGSNFARYCNRRVDSLLAVAPNARGGPERDWRAAVRLIAADLPALFFAAPVAFPAVHRRFTNVSLRPESTWSTVWQWSVRPGQQIDRDRQ
jgi:peptide/nickel transport system substrate-binding protein